MATNAILDKAKNTLSEVSNVTVVGPTFRDSLLIEYEPVSATVSMSEIPRFGHTRNFANLFYPTDSIEHVDARTDYWEGLFFVAAFVLAVFLSWSLFLVTLKLLWTFCGWDGKKQTRKKGNTNVQVVPSYLAGKPFTLYDEEPTNDQMSDFTKRSTRKRIVFLTAGSLLILFAILLVTKGFQQVEETRSTADHSLDNVRGLIDDATILAVQLEDVGVSASTLRDSLVHELSQERLCPNDPNYMTQDEIGQTIQDNAQAAIDMLEMLGEFARTDLIQMKQGLNMADRYVDALDSVVEEFAKQEWIGIAFVLPLVFLTALLMVGAMAAQGYHMKGCMSKFLLSYVVLPLFAVWIVMSYLFCSGLAVSASANADFCAGGADQTPDSTILEIITNAGLQEGGDEYAIARYYLRQCTAEAQVDPFLFLRRHESEIVRCLCFFFACWLNHEFFHPANSILRLHFMYAQITAQGIVVELSESLQKIDVETFSYQCGRDFQPLSSAVGAMEGILNDLDQLSVSTFDLLSCERIVPVYAEIVYDGTCNHSVAGFTWMFASLLIIATMGMIMIMLRSSYLNNLILADHLDGTSDNDESELHQMHNRLAHDDHRRRPSTKPDRHEDAHDLQLREQQRWRDEGALRQDTSDTASVYTDGNGDLVVIEVDPSDPYMMEDAPRYDRYGRPVPTAPMERSVLPQY